MKLPDQNVLAGGLAAVIAWVLVQIADHFGLAIDPTVQTAIVLVIGFGLAHFVPLSAQDIINRLNDSIVHLAQRDPTSNVSYVVPPVRVPPGEPATIGGPATVGGLPTVTTLPLAAPPPIPVTKGT